jgi:hypothetical protein
MLSTICFSLFILVLDSVTTPPLPYRPPGERMKK